jgi:hypothetical protein
MEPAERLFWKTIMETEVYTPVESGHIDNTKLYLVVAEEAVLTPAEVEHLKVCEECLQLIRVMVRNRISKAAER